MVTTVSAKTRSGTANRTYHRSLILVTCLGAANRFVFVAKGDFPLHDGGLFYVMIRDLQQNSYRIPAFTSYNHDAIPFAYPPLAFYLAGLLNGLAGIPLTTILRFLPYLVSLGCMAAFAALAHALLPTRTATVLATFVFACAPRAFNWIIMGGGLTRSFGQLFALLLIHRLYLLYRTGDRRNVVWSVAFATLLCLSHLEWAYFGAYSALLFLIAHGRNRRGLNASIAIGLLTLGLIAPWLIVVVGRHGLTPFIASVTGSAHEWPLYRGILQLVTLYWTTEPLFPLITALALAGFGLSLQRRQWFVPAWLVLIFVIESRGSLHRSVIPVALLAGTGLEAAMGYLGVSADVGEGRQHSLRAGRLAQAAACFLIGHLVLSGVIWPHNLVTPLSSVEREAMTWIASNTPSDARFLVVTGDEWGVDRSQEWFPALADRVSVTTTQGYEWVPGAFAARADANDLARACAWQVSDCIVDWVRETGITFDYVYVAKRASAMPQIVGQQLDDCCEALRESLNRDKRFVIVFDNDGATIYRVVRPSSFCSPPIAVE